MIVFIVLHDLFQKKLKIGESQAEEIKELKARLNQNSSKPQSSDAFKKQNKEDKISRGQEFEIPKLIIKIIEQNSVV